MAHAPLIVQKLAQVLDSLKHPCTIQDQAILLTRWSLRVDVQEGNTNQHPSGGLVILPAIITSHRYLPHGFARELAVGIGPSVEQAVANIVSNWMLLFFPLMKFLFEDEPHDCFVHEEPVDMHGAHQPYRLVAGPMQMHGFGGSSQPEQVSQSLLWNQFFAALLPRLGLNVHHIRCFAGRMPDGPRADVFVDGVEWPEGNRLLARLSETFPPCTEEIPIYALKQHLLIRPNDLEQAAREETKRQISLWSAAIQNQLSTSSRGLMSDVLLALSVMSFNVSQDEQAQTMVRAGLPSDRADSLISFLQSAAARILLEDKIGFSDTYFLANHQTNQAVERRYDQTPEFSAGLEIFRLLQRADLAEYEITAVADASAEMNGVRQIIAKEGKLTGGKFTQMVHSTRAPVQGVDLKILMSKHKPAGQASPALQPSPLPTVATKPPAAVTKKSWWKFW